ncbi:hypothetical protein JTE90_001551 [Oedothorax gibbosus]|uniref:Proteasome maturation protein n=1 Tax=Oedothorax gibbosus TaxID=931172 RepID=A0AAV6VMA2_9ARAC|nr:hypothetical protein JTE90_001551 [Oedothorax gibbosus]
MISEEFVLCLEVTKRKFSFLFSPKTLKYLKLDIMDLPSLKPQPKLADKVQLNETGEFRMHETMTNGFAAVRGQLCNPHALEHSEKIYKDNAEKMRLAMLRSTQGIHAPLKIMYEKNAARKVQRLPFLPSSNIALETLEGRDEFVDYDDYIFHDPEEGVEMLASPHMVMEKHLFSGTKQ